MTVWSLFINVKEVIMNKIQKHIQIARSSTQGLRSMGKKSATAIYELLDQHYETVGVSLINNIVDLEQLVALKPDLVFVGLKYVPGLLPNSKVWVTEYLDLHGIKYTGSSSSAIKLEQNKPLAKHCMTANGIKTSMHEVVKSGDTFIASKSNLRYPLFVKPTDLGAGVGIDDNSIVHNQVGLDVKLKSIESLAGNSCTDSLIEEYLPGREYSVAILKEEDSDNLIAMPLELVAGENINGYRILSYELKSAVLETPVRPVTDNKVRAKLIEIGKQAFVALGARDYGRIDIRMDQNDNPNFLEANLIPCIIENSGNFPKACVMNIDLGYESMILSITRLGFMHDLYADDTVVEHNLIAVG